MRIYLSPIIKPKTSSCWSFFRCKDILLTWRAYMQEFSIPLDEEVVDIAEFFKVFGDPTRLKILFLLEQGELGVNAITDTLGMQQSTISQQLKLLRARRLVRFRKEGRNVLYRLNDEHIHSILALGMEHYEELF
jgi:DNA-binding transcriptional ArsR family regulator